MAAPTAGLALPRSTPQPVVCGQLASSHNPITGSTLVVSDCIVGSVVNTWTHSPRPNVVHVSPTHEPIIAIPIATTNETWADLGRPAPSSFATRVETAELRVTGIVYNNDVVWMTMAAVANAVCGSRR
ncbi:Os12g0552575 [Oryza sativa Japonica Group]|uniref:Os12g0552575 protein n=1 Tax=Oryza sativa subsp. japonica TaxID=39947 RepID=A0A0P0YBL1_ORYSJ|nr:hypothetical protein EE612_060165 [Oryza sativa]BAT17580.1 Os12g0552575 [Oryza sativa Japonica Group]